MTRAQARRQARRGATDASSCDSLTRGGGAGGAGSLVAAGTSVEWAEEQCGVRGTEAVHLSQLIMMSMLYADSVYSHLGSQLVQSRLFAGTHRRRFLGREPERLPHAAYD